MTIFVSAMISTRVSAPQHSADFHTSAANATNQGIQQQTVDEDHLWYLQQQPPHQTPVRTDRLEHLL